ncbi:5567_t:CDS:2, partial [Scutellospora calospora]
EEQKRREAEHNSKEKRTVLEKQYKEEMKLKEKYNQIEKTRLDHKQKELLIEVKRIKEKKTNKGKTAIEILFQNNQPIEFPKITIEEIASSITNTIIQIYQEAEVTLKAEIEVYIPQ